MLKKRIIPILLKKKLGLVKGKNFLNLRRVADAMPLIKLYNIRDVDEICLLDVEATINSKMLNPNFISTVAQELNVPFGYGGGIRDNIDAVNALHSGADKVIINTCIYSNFNIIDNISNLIGAQSVTISIDVKKIGEEYICFSNCGNKNTNLNIIKLFEIIKNKNFGEIILTSIDKEGTMTGYDLDLIKLVSRLTKVPIVASGGAGNYDHMVHAIKAGASAVAASSIFHFTHLTPSGARKYLYSKGIETRDGFKFKFDN